MAFSSPVQVAIVDAAGSVVSTATDAITLTIPAGATASLSGDRTVAAASGIATFPNLELDGKVGAYALTATADSLTGATSVTFALASGTTANLAFDAFPGGAMIGAPLPGIVVREIDRWRNVVTTASDTIVIWLAYNAHAGTLSGNTIAVAVAGVAVFSNLHIDKPDSGYNLVASVGSPPFVTTSDRLIVGPHVGNASRLSFQAQPLRAATGFPLAPVQVALLDASGTVVSNATDTVRIAVRDGTGATIATASAVAVAGVATFGDLRIGQAGDDYTLTATAPGRGQATSAAFSVVAPIHAPPPAALAAGLFTTCGASTSGPRCWGDDEMGLLGDDRSTFSGSPVAVNGGHVFSSVETARFGHFSQQDGFSGMVRSCALDNRGAAWCWGFDDAGRVNSVPVAVPGGISFASLTMAEGDVCGLTARGLAYCWGFNDDNEFGTGNTYAHSSSPVAAGGGITFASLSAGAKHVCGLDTGGIAWCWGALGDSTGLPVQVTGGATFTSIASGGGSSCGLTSAGAAFCWGTTRQPVEVGGGHRFTAISAGQAHNCGLDAAGAAWCWGSNASGQLGDGTTNSTTTPVAVAGGLALSSINAGNRGTCGVSTTGTGYCWGNNSYHELGDGTTTTRTAPVAVSGDLQLAHIQAGAFNGCGLAVDGSAWCWGDNSLGELGDGHPLGSFVPTLVAGGATFDQFVGGTYENCALTAAGAAWCWGAAVYTGSGSTGGLATAPVAVSGGLSFRQLTGAQDRTCGLTQGGSVWCWGFLSNVSTVAQPISEADGYSFVAIAAGSQHTCGLTSDGAAWCWGARNDYGQLGNSGGASLAPVPVSGGLSFISIAAGGGHTCGLTAAGEAFCWGINFAQSGAGTLGAGFAGYYSSTPLRVSGNHVFMALSASADHTCGLTTDGEAWCWGWNGAGLLGNGTTAHSSVPVAVAGGLRFASIAAGGGHNCGVTTAGDAWCWGDNDWKQLGVATTTNSGGNVFSSTPVEVSGGFQFNPTAAAPATVIAAAPRMRPVAAPLRGPSRLSVTGTVSCAPDLPVALKARYRSVINRICGSRLALTTSR